ncbi:class I mannose-6-phosphate isomerase [Pedobacter cryoconitis]|uniref:Mannose-6-phosphate isomerase class I n=1 Tax=Pedobacter cryoconitis TaxID=188932 RepID=A0A7X0J6F0_9SPHI|nr:class I mannose-6-phosphate isomerase [Pedobacter cryoconitis]MBB6501951.1 mannose-6-phosphate isomerase class I [Pedobacter cryoconitis]
MTDSRKDGITTAKNKLRNTGEFIIPGKKVKNEQGKYDIFPAFNIEGAINNGFDSLAHWIACQGQHIIIDGYSGVYWDLFIHELDYQLIKNGKTARWINIDTALKSPEKIDVLIQDNLQLADPVFGKLYEGELSDFFDQDKLNLIRPEHDEFTIIYGCGAALAKLDAKIIYIDVPKNEIQFRSRTGLILNIGDRKSNDPKLQYKRFYFIDWPVLNKHKRRLLAKLDIIVDEQRITEISWIEGKPFRAALDTISKHSFRARPWFEPGVWGGQWMKKNIAGLNQQAVNYAWSFELIAPENGIILENNGKMLEVSFDMLLFNNAKAILGKAANRFGYQFPIRFDFLDTMDGGELSLQCHPTVAYTKTHFGEDFTQDETYYILERQEGSKVYLGFQENINSTAFRTVLEDSFKNNIPVAVEEYVQSFPSQKHDLFLIPNGTVHSSGKNNLVLEISATPYIFTFKMYDWLRPDLNGKPRPLNIDRAFANLDFTRKGEKVTDTLISRQTVIKQGTDWQILDLSTHPDHFYAIHRFEFASTVEADTEGQCHILSLVEGDSIIVKTGELEQEINFAETFIIPADAINYQLINQGKGQAKVLTAFVKEECC